MSLRTATPNRTLPQRSISINASATPTNGNATSQSSSSSSASRQPPTTTTTTTMQTEMMLSVEIPVETYTRSATTRSPGGLKATTRQTSRPPPADGHDNVLKSNDDIGDSGESTTFGPSSSQQLRMTRRRPASQVPAEPGLSNVSEDPPTKGPTTSGVNEAMDIDSGPAATPGRVTRNNMRRQQSQVLEPGTSIASPVPAGPSKGNRVHEAMDVDSEVATAAATPGRQQRVTRRQQSQVPESKVNAPTISETPATTRRATRPGSLLRSQSAQAQSQSQPQGGGGGSDSDLTPTTPTPQDYFAVAEQAQGPTTTALGTSAATVVPASAAIMIVEAPAPPTTSPMKRRMLLRTNTAASSNADADAADFVAKQQQATRVQPSATALHANDQAVVQASGAPTNGEAGPSGSVSRPTRQTSTTRAIQASSPSSATMLATIPALTVAPAASPAGPSSPRRTSARERRERKPYDPAATEVEQRQRRMQAAPARSTRNGSVAVTAVAPGQGSGQGQTQANAIDLDVDVDVNMDGDAGDGGEAASVRQGRKSTRAAQAATASRGAMAANGRPIKPLRRAAAAAAAAAEGSSSSTTVAEGISTANGSSASTRKKSKVSKVHAQQQEESLGPTASANQEPQPVGTAAADDEEEDEVDPVWEEFSADYHEVVEQLPLELHRNFALLRELDDQTRQHTVKLLEVVRKYVVARLGIERVPEGHALRQAVGAEGPAEAPTMNGDAGAPNGEDAGPAVETSANGAQDPPPAIANGAEPAPAQEPPVNGSQQPAPTANSTAPGSPPRPGTSAYDAKLRSLGLAPATSALLPELARLSREVVQGADDQLGVAQGAYNSVDRHIRALDSALQHQQQHQQQQAGGVATEAGPSSILQPAAAESVTPVAATPAALEPEKRKKGRKSQAAAKEKGKEKVLAQDGLAVDMEPGVSDKPLIDGAAAPALGDMAVDPHEPRYCMCHNVAFGEMLGCDNEDCPIEWYHLSCLGMERAPAGKWICDVCSGAMAKRTQQVTAEKKSRKRKSRF